MSPVQPSSDPCAAGAVVIGAGPAGLAAAASLLEVGERVLVLEKAACVGSAWRGHYERLHLHTVKQHSALPLLPFPRDYPKYVPRAKVVDYLTAYAAQFGISPRFAEEAIQVRKAGEGGWITVCRSGFECRSAFVVVATGANQVPNLPALPGISGFTGRVLHSADYRSAREFAGKRVLVIGMGNTGAEIALDLAEHEVPVAISVRSPVNVVYRDVAGRPTQLTSMALSRLPEKLGDAVALALRNLTVGKLERYGMRTSRVSPLKQLREEGRTPVIDVGTLAMIRKGRIAVRPGIDTFTPGGVRFLDGVAEPCDAVILATGFHSQAAQLFRGLEVPVDDKGLPRETIGRGPLDGAFFVGFDVRQPGGLLRTIGLQAQEVARAVHAPRGTAEPQGSCSA
ncbi:MAG TPA: NAD(P)/FAD-dependent oxidoreductase [Ramlibacter sp.]|nr:NAD(P)/FAD-dependent oxidoreductase [Ramlibacter sp.]